MANDPSVTGQLEAAQAEMEAWTKDTTKAVLDAIGQRPYGQEKVPGRQQALQGATIYHDPNAWAQIIQTHGAKPALEYAQRLQRLSTRFPEEFAKGQMAAGVQQPQPDAAPPQGDMNGPTQ